MDDEAMRNEVLVVRDLSKTYPNGNMAVQRLAFSVGFGECFGLLGINGAGKTSTFRMLTGEFAPSGGNATVRR
jgi:ABC-type multidrug transport system ATPase subunit